jgi:hypothetical protein
VRRIDAKYIAAPLPEYYHLAEDPQELRNLLESDPHAADELAAVLKTFMARWSSDSDSADGATTPDPEAIRRLASLGYISTPSAHDPPPPVRPDPKDMVPIWRQLRRNDPVELNRLARGLLRPSKDRGAYRRAVILAEAACKVEPDNLQYHRTLGRACRWVTSPGRPASRVAWGWTSPFGRADAPEGIFKNHPDTNGTAAVFGAAAWSQDRV